MELTKEERDYLASKHIVPCPFCGAAPVIEKTCVVKVEYVMSCPLCGSVIMKSHDLPSLIAKWNHRYYRDRWDNKLPDKSKVIEFLKELRESCKARSINADEEWNLTNELIEMMEAKEIENG